MNAQRAGVATMRLHGHGQNRRHANIHFREPAHDAFSKQRSMIVFNRSFLADVLCDTAYVKAPMNKMFNTANIRNAGGKALISFSGIPASNCCVDSFIDGTPLPTRNDVAEFRGGILEGGPVPSPDGREGGRAAGRAPVRLHRCVTV
jgi:hypothetical protein